MKARIYKLAKTSTQSGKARLGAWALDFEPETPKAIEPLMGWTASADMRRQVQLRFDTLDEATAYATRERIPFEIEEPAAAAEQSTKSYSDNFKFDRKQMWTH